MMFGMFCRKRSGASAALLVSCFFLVVWMSCAQPTAGGGVQTDVEAPQERAAPIEETPIEETPIDQDAPTVYDLEEEMQPEDTPADPEELEEEFEPLQADTVSIEEVTPEEPAGPLHDLGYRVQIFASSDLLKAKAVRDAATAQTGYAAYVEYEGGLYKVRVGNFSSRPEAAEARMELAELYPDCWIVQTTIRR